MPGDKDSIEKHSWSDLVIVAQIPETGLHRELEAGAAQREALARIAGVREVLWARAVFDLKRARNDEVQVRGTVSARVGQTCVVTLEPIESDIVEPLDLTFVPEDRLPQLAASIDDHVADEDDAPDPPEPIVNGMIDLGRLATDVLFLGIDPYPRKPGAVFEPPSSPPDPQDHPFAALEALKKAPARGSKKRGKE